MRVRTSFGPDVHVTFTELRPSKKASLLHRAKGATTALVQLGRGLRFLGTAYTSRKDTPDRFVGRKLALQRALQAARLSLDENDRLRIWVAFFARELETVRKKHDEAERSLNLYRNSGPLQVDPPGVTASGIGAPVPSRGTRAPR